MTLKVDFSKFDKKLTDVTKTINSKGKEVIRETSEQAIKIIVKRTREKGTDRNRRRFKRYSDAYALQRVRAGAKTKVVLTSTGKVRGGKLRGNAQGGSMLNSLTIVRTELNGLKSFISSARKKELDKLARHVRGTGSLPKRDPLGFTGPEEDILIKRAAVQMTAFIQKIGKR